MTGLRRIVGIAAVVFSLVLVAAACGDEDTTEAGGLSATGAWARTSPMMAEAGAAYMELSSDEAVTIVSASVPADVAATVELHETVPVDGDHEGMESEAMSDDEMEEMAEDMDDMADGEETTDGAMDDGDMEGDMEGDGMEMAMTMQEVTGIDIPAGGTVSLEPGGLHVMLLDMPQPLEAGQSFDLTLTTDAGDTLTVPVEVRDDAP